MQLLNARPQGLGVAFARFGRFGQDGKASFVLKPTGNTRLFARAPGCTAGESVVVSVRRYVTLSIGVSGRTALLTGRINPVGVQRVSFVYRDVGGRKVVLGTTATASDGSFRWVRQLIGPASIHVYATSVQDLSGLRGQSAPQRLAVR